MRMASEIAVSKAARRQTAKSENCSQRVHDDAHQDCIDEDRDHSDPESAIARSDLRNRVSPDRWIGRCRRRRGLDRDRRSHGRATTAAELIASRIRRSALIAEQSSIHGGHYKRLPENCKEPHPKSDDEPSR